MSTFSTDLKLELIGTGEASGTWGEDTNNNLNLIQQAIAGVETVTLSSGGTLTLVMTNKTISNARNMVIKFTTASIAASTICTVPDGIEKFYIFDATGLTNPTNLQIKTASGTGFTLDAAKIYAAYTDGTNLTEISLDTLGGTVGAAQIADSAVTTAKIADDAVTLAKMAPGTDGNVISYDASGNPVAVATGTAGQILTSAGAGAPPTFADASSGGTSWVTTPKTATFTAVSGEGYFANTAAGAFNITLPSSPSAGDFVAVKDYAQTFGSNALTVDRNSSPINGGNTVNPTLTTNGQSVVFVYVDATRGWLATQDDSSEISGAIQYVQATVSGCGNTLTTSSCGDYKIAKFVAAGNFQITCAGSALGSNTIDYLVVAGGGGGNSSVSGGGGGAGGFRYSALAADQPGAPGLPLNACSALPAALTTYPVVIGAGGAGTPGQTSGVDTVFRTITSAGGGSGGAPGGSGGGKQHRGGAGGSGNTPPVSPPQGNPGGASPGPTYSSGGGGGAMAAGQDAQPPMPQGPGGFGGVGAGVPSVVFGPSGEPSGGFQYFAGGGGGGAAPAPGVGGVGGLGGGGNGGSPSTAEAGTANTGGGGGGQSPSSPNSGAGGSGIVLIRYKFQN